MPERCRECGCLTDEGRRLDVQRAKERPIYGTNFGPPLSETIQAMRGRVSQLRGELGDIRRAFPGWGERLECVEGLLTCGLIALQDAMQEMQRIEKA